MSRFVPEWAKVRPAIQHLRDGISGAEHLLTDAFKTVAAPELKVTTVADVERHLRAAVGMGNQIPWVLFETITELSKRLPQAMRDTVAENVRIQTVHSYEHLRITTDGRWQVAWEINPAADAEDREIGLDWYNPNDRDGAPIVPSPLLDYIAGCVSLLKTNLVLPAAAVLSIALEAALWDALTFKGISRKSERRTYAAVNWKLRRLHNKLLITVEGADKGLKDLKAELGEEFTITLRRLQSGENQERVGLSIDADAKLVEFLATETIEETIEVPDKGLTVAIQRARSESIDALQSLPQVIDITLILLRNNLIHLPANGMLSQTIPIPGGGEINHLDDLKQNPNLVRTLLPWIVEVINNIYLGQHLSNEVGADESQSAAVVR